MSTQKNNKKNKDYLDMSFRKKIDYDLCQKYSDEELETLIIELNKQITQLNDLHKKLYSTNVYIERIHNRSFGEILREKIVSTISNTIYMCVRNKEKRKS